MLRHREMWRSPVPNEVRGSPIFYKIKDFRKSGFAYWSERLKKKMKFFVYILESEIDSSFYIGQTANLEARLKNTIWVIIVLPLQKDLGK